MLANTPKELAKPRQYAGEKKRATLTFRVRGNLYERLQHEAEASGRSLSETIEAGLEHYFEAREQYNELARLVGLAVAAVEAKTSKRYFADLDTREKTRIAIDGLLDILLAPSFDEAATRKAILDQDDRVARHVRYGSGNLLISGPAPDLDALQSEYDRLTGAIQAKVAMLEALKGDTLLPDARELAADDPRHAEVRFLRDDEDSK